MITIELNEHAAEDVKDIQMLQSLGVPDALIQKIYDREQKRRKEESECLTQEKRKASK